MLANTSPAALGRIEVFAKNLGLAFQITDDILDVTGNPEHLGKDVGKDADRLTFVKLAGIDGAKKLSDELVETSLSSISNLGPAAAPAARPRHDRPRSEPPDLSHAEPRSRGDRSAPFSASQPFASSMTPPQLLV